MTTRRISFWSAATAETLPLPEVWCLTKKRGWIRVDDVAALIRSVAEKAATIPVEDYEKVFQLTESSLAASFEVGDISEQQATAMVEQIRGIFIKQ